jgi:type II secretory pathway component PulK
MRRRARRGVALIVVLCLLIVLGALATDVVRATRLEAGIVENIRSRTVARYAAESGVVAAVARIDALLASLRSPADRALAFRDLDTRLASLQDAPLGGARFGVAVSDLNARIDLNQSDTETVRALFRQFTSDQEARVIVASLKARPVERIGELGALPGMTDAVALAVAPYVTVWSDGDVNINSAPEPVLAALPGLGDAAARDIVARRAAGEVFTSAAPQQQSQGARITFALTPPEVLVVTEPTRLLIIARGWRDGSPLTHEIQAVYAVVGAHLVLQAWQERDL